VGTGRLIFSLNFSDADFEQVLQRFVFAGRDMRTQGWWVPVEGQSNRGIRRGILREVIATLWGRGV
jgi:glutamate-1-semialdehyde 2,1-aminomutase